jgi:hypothetical protein
MRGLTDTAAIMGIPALIHRNNDGAAIAAGVGVLALIAILASQDQQDRQAAIDNPPPPPPENAYPQDYQGSQDYQGDQQYPQDYQGDPNGDGQDGPYDDGSQQ